MDSRLKRNVFLKALEALITMVASFSQFLIIARSYDPVVVGEYQVCLAWLFFVSALSCFGGIATIATREAAQGAPAVRSVILSSALILQIIISLMLCAIILVGHSYSFVQVSKPLLVGTVMLLGASVLQLSQAILLVEERVADIVFAAVTAHVVATIGILFAADHRASVTLLVGIWGASAVIQGALLFARARTWRVFSLSSVSNMVMKRIVIEMIPVLVMVLATHLYVRIDMIMLDLFTNKTIVAQYGAGYLFLDQLMILSNFMMSALFPNFARSTVSAGREYRILYRGIMRLFATYLFPVALLIAVFSKQLLSLIYGSDYSAAWPSLSILMVAALFAWANGPSGTIFLSLKKQYIYMCATLVSLAVNILGNLLLIPLIGAIGAAISTVLTEFAICVFSLYWIKLETGYLPWMNENAPNQRVAAI